VGDDFVVVGLHVADCVVCETTILLHLPQTSGKAKMLHDKL
jgi:hypothetical protein